MSAAKYFLIFIFLNVNYALASIHFKRRIFNGEDAEENQAPYLAQVRSYEDGAFRDEKVCGGALISEK